MAHSLRHLIRRRNTVMVGVFSLMLFIGVNLRADAVALRFISLHGELTGLLIQDEGGIMRPLTASEFALGRPVTLQKRPKMLRLFRESVVVDRVEVPVPMAEVEIPADADQFIVMLAEASVGSVFPLEGRVLDSSWAAHPSGTIRLVNLSTMVLALRIGGETMSLAKGAEKLVDFPAARQVPIEVAAGMPEGWQMISRGLRPTPVGTRVLCLIRDGRATTDDPAAPVEVRFLLDRTRPPETRTVQR